MPERLIKEAGESGRPDRVREWRAAFDETSRVVAIDLSVDLSFDLPPGSGLGADLLLKVLDKAPKRRFAH